MTVSLVAAPTVVNLAGNPASVAISNTPAAGDIIVLTVDIASTATVTVSGLGATWTQKHSSSGVGIPQGQNASTHAIWFGEGATSSGNITVTLSTARSGTIRAFHVAGLTANTITVSTVNNAGITSLSGPSQTADAGQFVVGFWFTNNTATTPVFPATETPSGWTSQTRYRDISWGNYNSTYKIPTSSATHQVSGTSAANATHFITQAVIGDAASSGVTGTVAATAPSAIAAMAGTVVATGTVAASAPPATAAIAGTVVATGTVAATAPPASAAIVGDVPTPITGDVTATAPAASSSVAGNVTVAGTLVATAPSASVLITGSGVTVGSVDATAPAASVAVVGSVPNVGTMVVTAPSATVAVAGDVVGATPTTLLDFRIPRRFDWVENGTQVDTPEVTVLRFASRRGFTMRGLLTPVAPPLGVLTEWPIQRQAHLMPALSAATPRFRVGNPANPGEYAVDYGDTGRLHVFVGGVDVTYLRGVPAGFDDYSSAMPMGPTQATIKMPQRKPWDESGVGDFAPFKPDAPVEIVMVRPDDTLDHKWEGFLSEESETSGSSEEYTFRAQGLFVQAAHQLWDPPVFMEPTDPAFLVADALNGVTHRRWNKIPRTPSGLTPLPIRGEAGQTVWQYVQDVLSQSWTDDGRQLTLVRVGPYSYRVQLKASTTAVTWTFTKGAPGVEFSPMVDQGTRRDAIMCRGFGPDGGFWCGRVFPGLEFGVPPRYPMNNTSLTLDGRSDATTDTGDGITTWQRQMRTLGYPVTVDGVMNPADAKWVLTIQRARGLAEDSSLGPQTWAATWENNSTDADLTSYRLPLAALPTVQPWLYSATGARVGKNPLDDPSVIRHEAPEVAFPPGISKTAAIPLARKILERESIPGTVATLNVTTDQHEDGASRYDIREGDNIRLIGHPGDPVFQVADVSAQGLAVSISMDTKARDALSVVALLERDRDALRNPSARSGTTDGSSLNKASVVQYESESKAGTIPRTAVNGDTGLWTVRKTFVSQVGVAKIAFTATSPKAELCVALFNRPIRTSVLAAMVADPLADSNGWYDNEEKLREKYGLMEIFGGPGNPGGYFPRQKGKGPLTGRLEDTGSTLYDSPYGGFVWVAMFTSRSTWVEGRVFPAVPT